MDGLILEFPTKQSGETCLAIFHEVAANYWAGEGYTIIDTPEGKAVVGKNSQTGEDNPEALTTAWDTLKESPDGTWYFVAPTPDPRFALWRDYMPEGIDLGTEKEMPEEWEGDDLPELINELNPEEKVG